MRKIRVLIIDDSPVFRSILTRGLMMDPEIVVVGKAGDPFEARGMIIELKPDVLTLDVEMPRMNGLEFVRKLIPQYPLPVIMVSSYTKKGSQITLDALMAGAMDFVLKPSHLIGQSAPNMICEIRQKVKLAAGIEISAHRRTVIYNLHLLKQSNADSISDNTYNKIIAIGASTGGTVAIQKLLNVLLANSPGIVITQHMPKEFTRLFAERLNAITKFNVKEAKSGDFVKPGHVLVAPGGMQMRIVGNAGNWQVMCRKEQKISGHIPSVDVLFNSVAKFAGPNSIGILLTGMGRDGAEGLLAMRNAGARTMAQDQKSSMVFGMPREAYANGGAEKLVSLDQIPNKISRYLRDMDKCESTLLESVK